MEFGDLRNEICDVGRRMVRRQLVAAHEGNISVRLPDDRFLCTPTMRCKGDLAADDLCVVDNELNVYSGGLKPTSEIRLHLEIYRQRPAVNAVVHAHPPNATAFAIANRPFPCGVLAEPDLFLGEVALAPFEVPGSDEFAKSVVPFAKHTNAIILANHGTVTYAEDLERALWMTEILESACKSVILSMSIGGPQYLSAEQGRALAKARSRYGFVDPRDLDQSHDVRENLLFRQKMIDCGFDVDYFKASSHDQENDKAR